jgi:hypothetical protein
MQRIHDATAAATLPAPPALTGPAGFFTGGAPGAVAPTIVRDWWLNMLQEELLALLTAAGITPDTTATNFAQVLAAIRALIDGQLQFGSTAGVGYYQRFGSGSILQGGGLSVPAQATRTYTFPIAFPTACLGIAVQPTAGLASLTTAAGTIGAGPISKTQFQAQFTTPYVTPDIGCTFLAWGN